MQLSITPATTTSVPPSNYACRRNKLRQQSFQGGRCSIFAHNDTFQKIQRLAAEGVSNVKEKPVASLGLVTVAAIPAVIHLVQPVCEKLFGN